MKFAHRVSNVSGGNKVVTVTTVAGKGAFRNAEGKDSMVNQEKYFVGA